MKGKVNLTISRICVLGLSGLLLIIPVVLSFTIGKFRSIYASMDAEITPLSKYLVVSPLGYVINVVLILIIVFFAKKFYPNKPATFKFYLIFLIIFLLLIPLVGMYVGMYVFAYFEPIQNMETM